MFFKDKGYYVPDSFKAPLFHKIATNELFLIKYD